MRRIHLTLFLLFLAVAAYAGKPVKNVIFMIGDGMGLIQMQVAMMSSDTPLTSTKAQYIGLATTHSANNRVTDSAASGTALATGTKTNNGTIGLDPDGNRLRNIAEMARENGKSTGVVVTEEITGATPSAFMAHQPARGMSAEIAKDIASSGMDVIIGGGKRHFSDRKDGVDLLEQLRRDGYSVALSMDEALQVKTGKLAALVAEKTLPTMENGRGDYLPKATEHALNLLSKNKKGFFLMVEGSMIDYGGHNNSSGFVISETVDFWNAVAVAFDFADRNPGTLVVVTADHETGGMTLPSGNEDFLLSDRGVNIKFSTKGHTAAIVPIYVYGEGAENFSTLMDNTDIPKKMTGLMKLK